MPEIKVVELLNTSEEKRTDEMYLEAIEVDDQAFHYLPVERRTLTMYEKAVKVNWRVLRHVPKDQRTQTMSDEATKQDWQALQHVPREQRTQTMCDDAVKRNWQALEFVPKGLCTKAMCNGAMKQNWRALEHIPESVCTISICRKAVIQDGRALEYVPENKRTMAICLVAFKHNKSVEFIPESKHTEVHIRFYLDNYRELFYQKSLATASGVSDLIDEIKKTTVEAVEYYSQLSKKDQVKLLEIVIEEGNAVLLHALSKYEHENDEETFADLQEEQTKNAQFLLSLDEQDRYKVTGFISESSTSGKITFEGGLLICAQIAARKLNYNFAPVLLKDMTEFSQYLKTLQGASPPIRERFVLTGAHWIAGDISINAAGRVSVLFMESLGIEKVSFEYVNAVKKIFENSTIYVPALKRQQSPKGCAVFALDDVRHLYTIENYLEDRYKDSGLHGYLAEHSQQPVEVKQHENQITQCELPLAFIRTTQSVTLLDLIDKRSIDEKAVPVKGCDLFVKLDDPTHPEERQNSDLTHVYLYKNQQDQIFYCKKGEIVLLEDKENLIPEAIKTLPFPEGKPVRCDNKDIVNPVLAITSKRGHTQKKMGERLTPEYAHDRFFTKTDDQMLDENVRIEHTLEKIVIFNLKFIKNVKDLQSIKRSMTAFTFESFQERMEQKMNHNI